MKDQNGGPKPASAIPWWELQERLTAAERRISELKASFMSLRSGGCHLAAMVEAAEFERDLIKAELKRLDAEGR
jgi:hypothetical protein